jgi:hypothetical protein
MLNNLENRPEWPTIPTVISPFLLKLICHKQQDGERFPKFYVQEGLPSKCLVEFEKSNKKISFLNTSNLWF